MSDQASETSVQTVLFFTLALEILNMLYLIINKVVKIIKTPAEEKTTEHYIEKVEKYLEERGVQAQIIPRTIQMQ